MRTDTHPSLIPEGLKGAAWGFCVEFSFALTDGLLSAPSLAAVSHKLTGYEAGVQARHVFQALGAWPMVVGAAVTVVRAKRAIKG